MTDDRVSKGWFRIPPWIILGSVILLVPILVYWTYENLAREKKFTTDLFLEKGAALIRSFEAGTRTGMMGMMGMNRGGFRLQRLLMETAQQPDIVYLIVTDTNGTILAANDPGEIGGFHGRGLDLKRISRSNKVEWRQVSNPDGTDTFEVFRRFLPPKAHLRGHHGRRMPDLLRERCITSDIPGAGTGDIIFVGLDMGTIVQARKGHVLHSVIMALILLLIGFAGIFSLFLVQAYRTTRRSLRKIKALSDNVIENMPIGLLAIDPDGMIAAFNQTAESVLKVSSSEVLGRNASDVLPPELECLTAQLETEKQIIEKEIECPLKDGKLVPMDISISSLEGDDGVFLGHIILFRDLTEIQELKGEIERSRRLASLGKLAAGIAHEIRNPLSSIKGFATYFKERYRDNPEDQQTANIMIQEVERLNRVIGQLLEFARPISIEKRLTDVPELIRQSLKLVEGDALQKQIQIEVTGTFEVSKIDVDPDKIKQILLNLYLNALEAMGEGGVLSVNIGEDTSGRIEITVSDTGMGIKKEELPHVFDPYFTTKPSGTGLGLAIVHRSLSPTEEKSTSKAFTAKEPGLSFSSLIKEKRDEEQKYSSGGG